MTLMYKLPSKITGVIASSSLYSENRKVKMFINHDQFENGSNMIISIVYKMILDFLNDHKFLPPILFLNLDNCGRENKNRYLLAFCCALVELDIFSEIVIYFLIVGHTG